MAIKVFYHVCAINHCMMVVDDYVTKMRYSGLYDACDTVYVCISGEQGLADAVAMFLQRSGKKYRVIANKPGDAQYERLTLHSMFEHVNPEDLVLYTHSKSVSHPGFPQRLRDWVDLMHFHLIARWRKCVELLTHDVDVVGTMYTDSPEPHFSGNFWWARGDYFLTLPRTIGPGYYDPELKFLFASSPRKVCLGTMITRGPFDGYNYPPIAYADDIKI